jgi:hypothetical protein
MQWGMNAHEDVRRRLNERLVREVRLEFDEAGRRKCKKQKGAQPSTAARLA